MGFGIAGAAVAFGLYGMYGAVVGFGAGFRTGAFLLGRHFVQQITINTTIAVTRMGPRKMMTIVIGIQRMLSEEDESLFVDVELAEGAGELMRTIKGNAVVIVG